MKNAIARIEDAIAKGEYCEPVMPVRIYGLLMSSAHLAAGADWRLLFSAETREDARQMVEDHGFKYDLHMLVTEEYNEIIHPKKAA